MKFQLLHALALFLIVAVDAQPLFFLSTNVGSTKDKPKGAQKVEFFGRVSCPLDIIWCVDVYYKEEDTYFHDTVKSLGFICSNGSRSLENYVFLNYFKTDTWSDEFEPYVLIQHDCSPNNVKYRYEHKYPPQSNEINCTSFEYDLNLLELGRGNLTTLVDSVNGFDLWHQRYQQKKINGTWIWSPPGFEDMPAPWGVLPPNGEFPTERCLKMSTTETSVPLNVSTHEVQLKNDSDYDEITPLLSDGSASSDAPETDSSPGNVSTPTNSTNPL
ncbi:hypothetical protein CRE_09730 [Caenorhabditis remanei]|uniref:Uncharacterized protein n=1 Tax=Caenorhabditis remanei TaxID=31234 RepID=E3N501_CAERE|nr:hypothetical protein CRE_09730 [Caenorhabditis remanei]